MYIDCCGGLCSSSSERFAGVMEEKNKTHKPGATFCALLDRRAYALVFLCIELGNRDIELWMHRHGTATLCTRPLKLDCMSSDLQDASDNPEVWKSGFRGRKQPATCRDSLTGTRVTDEPIPAKSREACPSWTH